MRCRRGSETWSPSSRREGTAGQALLPPDRPGAVTMDVDVLGPMTCQTVCVSILGTLIGSTCSATTPPDVTCLTIRGHVPVSHARQARRSRREGEPLRLASIDPAFA
jgi:hypothetical protein